jgi:hypothetical protein
LDGLSGKQDQRFHLSKVLTRYFDRTANAEFPGSSHADDIALDAWLRNQVLKRCVNVARPHRAYLGPLRVRQLGIRRAAAFAKSAHIEWKYIIGNVIVYRDVYRESAIENRGLSP